ncbi:MAG: tRNA (N6-threonylcarbamoyladenosine(37)-N6)-methyltransferase TrmO [Fibrobacterota bacterium]
MKKYILILSTMCLFAPLWAHPDHGTLSALDTSESSGLKQITYPVHPEVMGQAAIRFRPIGHFRTKYSAETGAPRQGNLVPENRGIIEIDTLYRQGLQNLSQFEYIIVLYHFNITRTWSPFVNPPDSKHHFGLFATRSPKRPNPIGFSVIRLDSVDTEKGNLYLSGVDAFDGTPVLDIKPYLPSVDIIESAVNRKTEEELGHHNETYINDSTMFR